MAVFASCTSFGTSPGHAVVPQAAFGRGVVRVMGRDGKVLGLAPIVRVTYDAAIAVATFPGTWKRGETVRVAVPGTPDPEDAHVVGDGSPLVIAFPRAARDLRPFDRGPPPALSGPIYVHLPAPAGGGPSNVQATSIAERTDERLSLALPSEESDRPALERARAHVGALVTDAGGRLIALVDGFLDESLDATPSELLVARALKRVTLAPGADLVRPDDGFLFFAVNVTGTQGLPRLVDRDGTTRDLLLEVRAGGARGGTIELPGAVPEGPALPGTIAVPSSGTIAVPAVGPVEVTLVARTSSFLKGESREEVSVATKLPALAARLAVTLELLPDLGRQFASARGAPRTVRVDLALVPVDPDQKSGESRSAAGATPLGLGRLAEGRVDLGHQAATDFFALDIDEPGPVVALLYRRTTGSRLSLRIFSPNFERDELALDVGPGPPRLAHARSLLLRGRVLARLRQVEGTASTAYELLVARLDDLAELVAGLFRLIGREAAREGAGYLDTEAFADEVAEALRELSQPDLPVARALIDQLENRVAVARRIAFRLLDRRLAAPGVEALLRQLVKDKGPRSKDAALLLARLGACDSTDLRPGLRECLRDADAYVRARALRTVASSRCGTREPAFLEELARACEHDESLAVRRAAEAALERAKRLRGVPDE